MSNLKPFSLPEALSGKAVMLRDGLKAYVRYHETELPVDENMRLAGFTAGGGRRAWCVNGDYYTSGESSDDIIGMYPETRVINGFEVPAPETKVLGYGTIYCAASTSNDSLYQSEAWTGHYYDKLWLSRGLVFLNKEDAAANTKAMLGIDPNTGD